ncbi:MAG: hypothetical protein Q8Q36_02880 [bacterium]|nr:hypothetical protein [bacterium]
MKVVCTICSKEKDQSHGLMPAWHRYRGSHIREVKFIAQAAGLRFFILSGSFGFIEHTMTIPHYDKALKDDKVAEVAEMVSDQLASLRIREIEFYAKAKEEWQPYRDALKQAATALGVTLTVRILD